MRLRIYSLAALLPALAGTLHAAPEELDLSFGGGGIVATDFSGGYDGSVAVAIQPDGKIVVVGQAASESGSDTALARYNPDGTLDASFGPGGPEGDGKVTTPMTPDMERTGGVAVQPDGKIVITGATGPDESDIFVARYHPDGSLDATFDGDGLMTAAPPSGTSNVGADLVLQPDGKIVVGGSTFMGEHRFLAMRLQADGSLDSSFDGDGFVITPAGGSGRSVALQSDGKILVGGGSFTVVRYHPDGSLDTSFDGDGIAMAAFVDPGGSEGIAIRDDGQGNVKIAAVGYVNNGVTNDLALALFNSDGSLDSAFDGDGRVQISLGVNTDEGNAVVFQADGKILVAASSNIGGLERDLSIVRFNENGSLDTTYGGVDGFEFTHIGDDSDRPEDIALQPDGRAVVVADNEADFIVVRYLGDSGDLYEKAADTTTAEVGDPVTYTLTVTNNGASALGGVTVTDVLDPKLTFQSASVGSGSCSGNTTVTCDLGTLAAAAVAEVTLIVRPNAAGTILNQATVSAQAVESNPADNTSVAVSLTATAAPDDTGDSGGCSLMPK